MPASPSSPSFAAIAAVALVVVTASACSTTTTDPAVPAASSGSSGGGGSAGSSGAGSSGTSGNPASSSGSSGAVAPDEGVGQVVVSSQTILGEGGSVIGRNSGVTAFFARFGSASAGSCTDKTEGTCRILECLGNGDALSGTAGLTSFGKLTIAGGSRAVELAANAGRYTPDVEPQRGLFEGGEQLTVAAPGDPMADTPPFSQKLTAPKPLWLSLPSPRPGDNLDIPASTELKFAWKTGGPGSQITVTLTGQSTGRTVSATCAYDGAPGAATIPPAVLKTIPAGEGLLTVEASASVAIAPQLAPRSPWKVGISVRSPMGSMRTYLH